MSLNSTVPWGNSLAPSKHLHTLQSGIYLPAASTPSKCHHFVWAKPSVLLTKAQCSKWWKINRGRFVRFPQDYADDKRQRLGREKANGVCSSNCSGGVCGVAAVWGEGQLRRLFVWVLWRRGVVERGQAGSIQQQRFPMWQHTNPAEQRHHTHSSVHLCRYLHLCFLFLFTLPLLTKRERACWFKMSFPPHD